MNFLRKIHFFIVFIISCFVFESYAGIVIHGTRIIYPAERKGIIVRVENVGEQPSLAQVWVDSGDISESAQNSDIPFFITPAISRIEPRAGKAFRVINTSTDENFFKGDVERLFYFNLLEVPPFSKVEEAEGDPYVQINIRNRLKMFFRPTGLEGSPKDAIDKLQWILLDDDNLKIINASAYHINFSDGFCIKTKKGVVYKFEFNLMAPRSEAVFDISKDGVVMDMEGDQLFLNDPNSVGFKYIDDFGAVIRSFGRLSFKVNGDANF